MQLCYRGVTYNYVPTKLEMAPGEQIGQYRGASWRSPHVHPVENRQPFRILRYRGILYATGTITVKQRFSEVE